MALFMFALCTQKKKKKNIHRSSITRTTNSKFMIYLKLGSNYCVLINYVILSDKNNKLIIDH